ncbi:MAG: helix-turn-helix domain-containing protein [Chryseolinea sp.]
MIYQEIQPDPRLKNIVKNYLLVNLYNEGGALGIKPYPTRIEQALVFFSRGFIECHDPVVKSSMRIPKNALFGQQLYRLNFTPVAEGDFLMLMVIFQPGAMHRLLNIPSFELSCQFSNAEDILRNGLSSVNDAIANSYSYNEMILHVNRFLCAKINKRCDELSPIDRTGYYLLNNTSPFSLNWLARQASLSPRQYERRFVERIGITPKLYSRIGRFFRAFEYKEKNPNVDWLTIAINFGFTDYNHMAKDFKQFANVSPNLLLDEYAKRPEFQLLGI